MSDISAPPSENRAPVVAAISMVEPEEPPRGWQIWAALVLSVVCAGAAWTAWNAQQRVKQLETELVRRVQESQSQSAEARFLARQAQEQSRDAAARTTLLDTRLAEVTLQRSQVEDLIKSLSLSRDEAMVVDIDATLRVAVQQSALTGSVDPLMNALQSADDRIARAKQPRLDPIRRALAKDLDRVRGTRVADLSTLTIRLDEAIRVVDEAPLLNQAPAALLSSAAADRIKGAAGKNNGTKTAGSKANEAASSPTEPPQQGWSNQFWNWAQGTVTSVWSETKGLVRVTRIARPEGMLVSPDQGFFLRENLKLRLLNARLALLSRQSASAIADIRMAQDALTRYFDTQSRKTQLLQSMLTEVAAQSPQISIPRPDDTLAALAAVVGTSR